MAKSILIIDDDPAMVNILQDILSETHCQFLSAGNGTDGIKKAQEFHPSLILLDVQLPDMNGFDVCQSLKQDPQTRNILILMLTGHYAQSSDKVEGLDRGADDYLVKPFDTDILIARVQALLRRNQL